MPSEDHPPDLPSLEEARHLVETQAAGLRPKGRELLDLLDGFGRVLAEPVVADRDFPPFPRSARDGYAVRAVDLAQLPATLQVVGEIKAGPSAEAAQATVGQGQAVSIMTGAPVPSGADAVVMVEYTTSEGNEVQITKGVDNGDNVVPTGAEAKRGERLLSPGIRLDPAAIAVAASVGRVRLLVHSQPRVTVLSTGDEVVDIDVVPGPYQIRNSNSYSLACQIAKAGGRPSILPIAPDTPKRLRELVVDGLDADLLVLTGGVSMGKHDLVEQVLAELKAEFFFTGALIQPGRPVVFGRAPQRLWPRGHEGTSPSEHYTYFFGLPGNPVSTMVTFDLFVRPMIEAFAGMSPQKLVFLLAKLKSEIKTKKGLKRVLPAVLSGEFEQTEVELVRWHGSGDIASTARANCYIVVSPDREQIAAGEWVPVLWR